MFSPRRFRRGILALMAMSLVAAVAWLATPGTSLAQPQPVYHDATGFWRFYNGQWYHYRTYVHGFNPGYYGRPDRVLPHGVSPAHYGAYLDPGAAAATTPVPTWPVRTHPSESPFYIEVRAPADAAVWFDGVETTQTGTRREFVSPPVAPGYDYTYEVRARWLAAGREVIQNRVITARAGDHVVVSFQDVPAGKRR